MQQLRAILILITTLFCALVPACSRTEAGDDPSFSSSTVSTAEQININTANAEELRQIPHVGESLSEAIIRHRETHGPFRRPEDVMLVDGISDARFRRIRHLIKTE